MIVRVEESIAVLKADLVAAGRYGTTVSVVGSNADDLFALSRTGAVGSLLTQLGLGRPAPQDIDTEPTNPFVPMSAEQLADHDANVIIVLNGAAYPTEPITGLPLSDTLEAVENDSTARVRRQLNRR